MIEHWTKGLARLTCGLGLLVLGATQQKVCTWREIERPESERHAACETPTTPDPARDQKPKPPTLAATVPDVVAPRREAALRIRAERRLQAVLAAASYGPAGSRASSLDDAGCTWRGLGPVRIANSGRSSLVDSAEARRVEARLLRSTIQPTGPPTR